MSPLRGGGGVRTKHYCREILKSPLFKVLWFFHWNHLLKLLFQNTNLSFREKQICVNIIRLVFFVARTNCAKTNSLKYGIEGKDDVSYNEVNVSYNKNSPNLDWMGFSEMLIHWKSNECSLNFLTSPRRFMVPLIFSLK